MNQPRALTGAGLFFARTRNTTGGFEMKPGLVQVTWPALREYIAVEVKLGVLRHELSRKRWSRTVQEINADIAALELQSTVLETSFREMLPEGSPADVLEVAESLAVRDSQP